MAYAYILDAAQLAQALAATNINLNLDGVNYTTGNTTNICSGTPVPLNLSNTGTFTSWSWTPSTGLNTTNGTSVIATVTSPITYTATGTGACGSTSVNISLNPVIQSQPAAAGAITGLPVLSLGQLNVTYSIPPVANATFYQWQLPPGAVVTSSKSDSNAISFNAPNTTWCGAISVQPKNSCGVGASSLLDICVSNIATGSIISPICGGANVSIPISIPLGYFLSGNVFTAQLSDSAGSFLSPVNIGTLTSTFSSIIPASIPENATGGNKYRIRVVGSNPVSIGTDNGTNITINALQTPDITITANQTSICTGTGITFTALTSGGGLTPSYQWQKNGVNAGTNTSTYTDPSFVSGDKVSCIFTGSAACFVATKDTSNIITLTSIPGTPSINIVANKTNICAGTLVTFTATTVNGGTAAIYQWKKNGVNVGPNSSSYADNSLLTTDIITCALTSNATCVTTNSAISNSLSVTVNANLVPSVNITASQTSICSGKSANITFTASSVNGGTSPFYQWKRNGVNVGTNSTVYTSNTIGGDDVITCVLTSSASCVTSSTATSNGITIVIIPATLPAVTISATSTAICGGGTSAITFTATPVNGGTSPIYEWKKNGFTVGTNSPTYTDNSFSNGTTIICQLKSNSTDACLATDTAVSNTITITVSGIVTPFVSIFSSTSFPVCSGSAATFTASPFNGGTSPTYQWRKNGINVGTNSSSYTTTDSLKNGDIINCLLTSNQPCASTPTATSNNIIVIVTTPVTPTITISATQNVICTGTTPFVTFTATATNQGFSPTYQWRKNRVVVFTSSFSNTYSTSIVAPGDTITCTLTSTATCISTATAISNNIIMSSGATAIPALSITASQTNICGSGGIFVSYTAIPTNGGSFPAYQWRKNGINVGTGSVLNLFGGIVNGDTINCILTSNLSCVSRSTATSNTILMTVSPNVTPSVSIVASQSNICPEVNVTFTATAINGGTSPSYQWRKNGANVGTNSPIYTDTTLTAGTSITCTLTSNLSSPCLTSSTASSNTIIMSAATLVFPAINVSASNTSICSGTVVTFTATPINGGTAPVYQWKKNGINVGTNSNLYIDSLLITNDQITCTLTSNANCLAAGTATSFTIFMNVTQRVTPTVTISATQNVICAGTTPFITFTATTTNAGFSPSYQWRKNGVLLSTTFFNTYSTNLVASGDVFTCTLISNVTCVTTNTAVSNSIVLTGASSATPSLVIVASQTTLCGSGSSSVNFTAIPTNGGGFPNYQWQRNGINVGTGSALNLFGFTNGDVISCVLTSSLSCTSTSTATSNNIVINVTPFVSASINIVASQSNICPGSNKVTFTATTTNGGASPIYQWRKNGVAVGTSTPTYIDSTLTAGTQITCVLTSSLLSPCLNNTVATSNIITISSATLVFPSVNVTATNTFICARTSVTFTATPTNGGTLPSYQWRKNNVNVGTNSNIYVDSLLINNDQITCTLTSNANCLANTTTTSFPVFMNVTTPVTPTVTISATQTVICTGTNKASSGLEGQR